MIEFHPTELDGVLLLVAAASVDERGLFARTYDAATFAKAGLPTHWPQCNTSWNRRQGTLRGMHLQGAPRGDAKIVRCTSGRIFDVVIDLRVNSRTYRQWIARELSAQNRNALVVPVGCAHGFLTLEAGSEVYYMMGETYVPELAQGVRWNDPAFAIRWPSQPVIVSERDASWPDFQP
jgi:dTDP-4-dehydrorhamnose 3,5-epimerase